MNLKTLSMMGALLLLAGTGANAQKKKEVLNDSNTPLHLLQPAYKVPYGMLTTEEIKADMDRVLRYLEKNTPTRVVDKNTGKVITDYANMTADAQLERGAFRLASYEWGVTYSAMLAAAEATGDQAYYKYVTDRFQFLAEVAPHFRKVLEKYGTVDPQMKQILTPHALDDAGAVCAAMVKVQMKKNSPELKPLIDNYMDFIVNKEYRLADGRSVLIIPVHDRRLGISVRQFDDTAVIPHLWCIGNTVHVDRGSIVTRRYLQYHIGRGSRHRAGAGRHIFIDRNLEDKGILQRSRTFIQFLHAQCLTGGC